MDVSHIEFITTTLTPWHWMTAGLLLCAMELLAPSGIFLWPGVAAIVTGVLTLVVPVSSWQLQVALFAVLAVSTALAGRAFYKRKSSGPSSLNRRAENLIGKTIILADPIVNGVGGAYIGGMRWRCVGPDAAAGSSMIIIALDGASLVVTPHSD
jgi:membrane protein implicated in regulation of membrane protease activity